MSRKLLTLTVAILLGAIVLFCSSFVRSLLSGEPSDPEYTLLYEGKARTYRLHVPPAYDGLNPFPLVIAMHGAGGSTAGMAKITRLNEAADRRGYIICYPSGSRWPEHNSPTWNAGNCCGDAVDRDVDDVGFIRALLKELQSQYRIDTPAVYAMGLSNGGMMSYRLACEMTEQIAAIGVVSGAFNLESCQPSAAVPVIVFHGTADELIRYQGGKPLIPADHHDRVDTSVREAVSFWVQHNDCQQNPHQVSGGRVLLETYLNPQSGAEVVLYTVVDGIHGWPGGLPAALKAPQPIQQISATELILDFFQKHSQTAD